MMLSIVLLIMRLELIDKLGLSAGGNRIRTAKAGVDMVKGVYVCVWWRERKSYIHTSQTSESKMVDSARVLGVYVSQRVEKRGYGGERG